MVCPWSLNWSLGSLTILFRRKRLAWYPWCGSFPSMGHDSCIHPVQFKMAESADEGLPSENSLSNRPFPSSLVPLFQNESKCETFHVKMSSACSFIVMQIKVIFIRMVSHLNSLWNRGTRELGNGLLYLQQQLKRSQQIQLLHYLRSFSSHLQSVPNILGASVELSYMFYSPLAVCRLFRENVINLRVSPIEAFGDAIGNATISKATYHPISSRPPSWARMTWTQWTWWIQLP